ncbi:hypothetical protein ACVOMV_29020 [Mesorhizobium atlanticum]
MVEADRGISLVLLLTAVAGYRLGFVETPPFLWVLRSCALLAALALLLAGLGLSRVWSFGDRGGRDLSVGALLALLVLAPYGVAVYWARSTRRCATSRPISTTRRFWTPATGRAT